MIKLILLTLLNILLLSVLSQGASAAVEKYEVRVADASTVRQGEVVRLGLISESNVTDAELQDRIYNLSIAEAASQDIEMTSEQLALALRDKLSFQDLQRVSFKIPEKIKIKTKANYFSPKAIAYQVKKDAGLVCMGCEVEIEELRLPEISERSEVLGYTLDSKVIQRAGSHMVPLYLETSKGKNVLYVTTRISFFKNAPVAQRLIRPGDKISDADFTMKRVSVSFAKDGVLDQDKMKEKVAVRMISAGQTIFISDLKSEPAILRGQAVKILIGTESLEISAQGVSEDSGVIGDVIKVRSPDSKKLLSGVLVEKGVVRIQ